MKVCCIIFLCIFAYVAAIERVTLPDDDRQYMKELIIQEMANHTEVEANKAIYELENYYTALRDGLYQCGPPKKLDLYYHLHILNTRLYRNFCQATFGRFIDHEPFWSGNPSSDQKQIKCDDQLTLVEAHGLNITCPCLWRTASLTSRASVQFPATLCIVAQPPMESF
ncbi:hypothetical protein I4U23_020101 [Adineta vaga]|nr:hypothetical protein I4U23_020101 [Adineta vaga]